MELFRRIIYAIGLFMLFSLNYQCASLKRNLPQEDIPFKVKTVSYQEWSTDGEEKGSGINVYVPIIEKDDDVIIDSIYFRNFKGLMVRNYSRYTSVLKNDSPSHVFNTTDKDYDFPFTQANDECVIRYIQNGKVRYLKVSDVIRKEEIYYKDGPPLAYQRRREAMIISEVSPVLKQAPTFQPTTSFKVKTIAFQEWYAGIKIGGTGMNVFVPIVNKQKHIKIDSVYFRNLKGQLVENSGRYTAVLKNKSPYYTFKKPEKDKDFPFILEDNECAISFVENGEVKYLKVNDISEKRGVYYENGPPKIYQRQSRSDEITSHSLNEFTDVYSEIVALNKFNIAMLSYNKDQVHTF